MNPATLSPQKRIARLREKNDFWEDSWEPITDVAVVLAVRLLQRIDVATPPNAVLPVADGGIQLEWHWFDHSAEAEVSPDGKKISCLLDTGTIMREAEFSGQAFLDDCLRWLREVLPK